MTWSVLMFQTSPSMDIPMGSCLYRYFPSGSRKVVSLELYSSSAITGTFHQVAGKSWAWSSTHLVQLLIISLHHVHGCKDMWLRPDGICNLSRWHKRLYGPVQKLVYVLIICYKPDFAIGFGNKEGWRNKIARIIVLDLLNDALGN